MVENNIQSDLSKLGLKNSGEVFRNLSSAQLYEHAIRNGEGSISCNGALVVLTGQHTGRSAQDKFVVCDERTQDEIWWGAVNVPYQPEQFDAIFERLCTYLEGKNLYVQDCIVGADDDYRLPIRVISELAWHNLFARTVFRRASEQEKEDRQLEFTVITVPSFVAEIEIDGTRSETFILIDFSRRLILIGGTTYAGETKKSIFTVMNYLMPKRGVLPMHASVNIGPDGSSAIFFGLSGTGKTTLSADPGRALVGDDEHGWSDNGLFNFEGGCYAKVINLSLDQESEIFETTRQFGTILENVVMDPKTREIDLSDGSLTENTRGSYSITQIPNAELSGCSGHPNNVVFLTCDAFGVLPPVSKLTSAQAMYHFISGYTAKMAGTEKSVIKPSPTFSPCYGGPFLPLHPRRYAEILGEKIEQHEVTVWFINTGWTGGPYGIGKRISIHHTRAIVNEALDGNLNSIPTRTHLVFGLEMPVECNGVPSEMLDPRSTWEDKEAYDRQAQKLAQQFEENFLKYSDDVSEVVRAAGPVVD
jgi:phosphoenolpyruvate carboxykinase (ATP)